MFLSFILSACNGDNSHIRMIRNKLLMIKTQEQQQETANPLAEFQMPASIEYGTSNINKASVKQNSANSLENFPLSAIQFVGTLKQENNQILAYVLIPNKMVFTVKVGDRIGDQHGKISNITENQIDIMENTIESGKNIQKIVTLKLKE